MASSTNQRVIEPEIWQACAGILIEIPKLDSLVYYFPQGHIEHASSTVTLSSSPVRSVLCRVANVLLLADPDTDQAYAKFLLEPWNNCKMSNSGSNLIKIDQKSIKNVLSFSNVFKPPFTALNFYTITKDCANRIFPGIESGRKIRITDIHGENWEFMLVPGVRDSMMFTTNWPEFLRIKKLKAGDTIVLMLKESTNEHFIGIRRGVNWSTRAGRNSANEVENAIEKAANKESFEAVYYPTPGLPEFVVAAEKVKAATDVGWRREMKVKIGNESGGEPRKYWYHGKILDVNHDNGSWPDSLWRMLQVEWNVGPEVLAKMRIMQKYMSPWELEVEPSDEPDVPHMNIMNSDTDTTSCTSKDCENVERQVSISDDMEAVNLPASGKPAEPKTTIMNDDSNTICSSFEDHENVERQDNISDDVEAVNLPASDEPAEPKMTITDGDSDTTYNSFEDFELVEMQDYTSDGMEAVNPQASDEPAEPKTTIMDGDSDTDTTYCSFEALGNVERQDITSDDMKAVNLQVRDEPVEPKTTIMDGDTDTTYNSLEDLENVERQDYISGDVEAVNLQARDEPVEPKTTIMDGDTDTTYSSFEHLENVERQYNTLDNIEAMNLQASVEPTVPKTTIMNKNTDSTCSSSEDHDNMERQDNTLDDMEAVNLQASDAPAVPKTTIMNESTDTTCSSFENHDNVKRQDNTSDDTETMNMEVSDEPSVPKTTIIYNTTDTTCNSSDDHDNVDRQDNISDDMKAVNGLPTNNEPADTDSTLDSMEACDYCRCVCAPRNLACIVM
ncbi:unnamed protein product [Amaranthus hypochondriacus]